MIYSISPNCPKFPVIIPGDIWIIYGREYQVHGIVGNPKLMNQIGVYGLRQSNGEMKIYLIHPNNEVDLIKAFQAPFVDHIASFLEDNTIDNTKDYVFEIFAPPIMPGDNYLKVIIKKILFMMQIDIRDYRPRFKNDNHFNNMRRLLTSDSNLTYEKFEEWMEILGYSHQILIYDINGNLVDLSKIPIA